MYEEICVEFETKQNNIGAPAFKSVLKSVITDLLNIIFDDFGKVFTDFWFEFSCLYIPQEHYFIVLSGYEVKMNM